MPERPIQHVTADQAVAAVRKIWAEQGAAVEEIRRDYGEDLLVQTRLHGRMNGVRIWLQTKGTNRDLRDSRRKLPSVSVRTDLAIKWMRSTDLVVVVLWDVNNSVGWFALPQSQLSYIKLLDSKRKRTNIAFDRRAAFDVSAAHTLAWSARIELSRRQLESALTNLPTPEEWDNSKGIPYGAEEAGAILFEIMRDVEIIDSEGRLHPTFRQTLMEYARELPAGQLDPHEEFSRLAVQSILTAFHDNAAGCLVPEILLVEIADQVVDRFLESLQARRSA
jgi:hypothetical protein